MTEITKDTLIGDILDADRGTAKYFLETVSYTHLTLPTIA